MALLETEKLKDDFSITLMQQKKIFMNCEIFKGVKKLNSTS